MDQGLGVYLVEEHGMSRVGNRVNIELPDADEVGGHVECTCSVPSRWKLRCCDVLAVLRCEL